MKSSRELAFDILLKVEEGGYAADLLAANSSELDARDAGLAVSLVLGVLRYRAQLDFLIAELYGRSLSKLDLEVITALRMGLYQIRYLQRIPVHAAVDTSVTLVKRARKRSATGLVNALLRKLKNQSFPWPDRATRLSCPEWMLARWEQQFGTTNAEAVAEVALRVPERFVRVPPGNTPPEGAKPTEISGCYEIAAGEQAAFRLQDIGSQFIIPLLDLRAGQRFLDLCAAPGNKTAQALETPLRAVACDVSGSRLSQLRELHIPLVRVDGEQPLPFGRVFDRILVDAPCSGTGTLAHNPEIKWRLTEADIARQATRQERILRSALEALAPGGKLVYSTCSLEREENEAVVERLAHSGLCRMVRRTPGEDRGDGFFAAVME